MQPRHLALPALTLLAPMPVTYAARLDTLTRPQRTRRASLWVGLVSLLLGLIGGLCLALLIFPRPAVAQLTPQQQTMHQLLQELAQTSTVHEAWVVLAKLEKVVRTLHPQPRPVPDAILPTLPGRLPQS